MVNDTNVPIDLQDTVILYGTLCNRATLIDELIKQQSNYSCFKKIFSTVFRIKHIVCLFYTSI